MNYRSTSTLRYLLTILLLFAFTFLKSQSFKLQVNNNKDSIQWQSSSDNANWSDIRNGNTNSLTLYPIQTTYYRARITAQSCAPVYSDVKAAVNIGDTLIGAKLIKGQLNFPSGTNIDVTNLTVQSILGHSIVNADGTFQLLVDDSAEEELLMAINRNGDLVMMGDFIGSQDPYVINSESTTLAILLMYPFLKPVETAEKQKLNAIYKSQPEYAGLLANVETVIKQGVDIFSENNIAILNSVITLIGKSYNDNRLSLYRPSKLSSNMGLCSTNKIKYFENYLGPGNPVDITLNGSIVSVVNNTTFSYEGGIYDNANNLLQPFLLDGSLIATSPKLQLILSKISGLNNISSQNSFDVGLISKGPGPYYIKVRSGLDISDFNGNENLLALSRNISVLSGSIIGNLLPQNLLDLVKDDCLKGFFSSIYSFGKQVYSSNPQAVFWKDIAVPFFKSLTTLTIGCFKEEARKVIQQAFKYVKLFDTYKSTLLFGTQWVLYPNHIDGCNLLDGNKILRNCFQFTNLDAIKVNYNACDVVPLTIQAKELKEYYPYTGDPVENLNFSWIATSANSSFGPDGSINPSGKTDDQGIATINWVMPPNSRAGPVSASAVYFINSTLEASVDFKTNSLAQTIIASPYSTFNNQSGRIDFQLGAPIFISLVDQQTGKNLSQDKFNVSWELGNNGSISPITSGSLFGSIAANWTLGPNIGIQNISANIKGNTGCDLAIQGNPVTFTATAYDIPKLTTHSASAITDKSALSGGDIISGGGFPITANGVCWSISQNPTISDSKTTDAIGQSIFASSISGLQAKQIYFVRAYASDYLGTYYGNQISFTTIDSKPQITILKLSVDNLTGVAGNLLPGELTIKTIDDLGNPVSGINILWTTQNGTVTGSVKTDANGQSSAIWILGTTPGQQTVKVKATDDNGNEISGSPITFTATATPPAKYALSPVSGGYQQAPIGTILSNLLVVKVLDDRTNPVAGINIAWSTSNGTINGSLKTDANGEATAGWTLGLTPGLQTVTVRATDSLGKDIDGSPLSFYATAQAINYSIAISSGNNQTSSISSLLPGLLKVKVVDDKSGPAPGINLLWTTAFGSINGALKTDANGEGTASWTLGSQLGSQTSMVKATDNNGKEIIGSPITFNATAIPIDTFRYKTTFTLDGYNVRSFPLDLNLHFENGTITGLAYGSSMWGATVTGSTDGSTMTLNIDWDNHVDPNLLVCNGVAGDGCRICQVPYHEIRKWSIKGTTDMTHSYLNATYSSDITGTQMIFYAQNDGTCEEKLLTQTTNVTGTLVY